MRTAWIVALLCLGSAVQAAQPCGVAKLASSSTATVSKLGCHASAAANGTSVDSNCLAAADATLTSEFAVIEADGGCTLTGDASATIAVIDDFAATLVAAIPPAPGTNACRSAQLSGTAQVARLRAQCHRRAERRGTDVTQKCIGHTYDELTAVFERAQRLGGCSPGIDAADVVPALDAWSEQIAGLTRPVRRVSVSSRGSAASRPSTEDRISSTYGHLSANGRFVVFNSNADDLIRGDQNGRDIYDVLVHDLLLGTTEMASISNTGVQADNDPAGFAVLSGDGRFVAFDSHATTLVPDDTNGVADIFVRDRWLATTERINLDSNGAQAQGGFSIGPTVSADGRFVAFYSYATNLVPNDTNARADVFVRDRVNGTTERDSVAMDGTQGDSDSFNPTLSDDGSMIAFWSTASNLISGDVPSTEDLFLVERATHSVELVSVTWDGNPSDAPFGSAVLSKPSLSADVRFVAFSHLAGNLVAGDDNNLNDVFVRDRLLGTTERISIGLGGAEPNGRSIFPSISADGRFVAFESDASNLVPGDTNAATDVFVADRSNGTIIRVSTAFDGAEGNQFSTQPVLSADGRRLVFWSRASNLVRHDRNGNFLGNDVFVRSLP